MWSRRVGAGRKDDEVRKRSKAEILIPAPDQTRETEQIRNLVDMTGISYRNPLGETRCYAPRAWSQARPTDTFVTVAWVGWFAVSEFV